MRQLLDEMSRPMLYALARAAAAAVRPATYKDELIDAIVELDDAVFQRALEKLALGDLRALCARLGYRTAGTQAKLAARLIAALEEPTARITRWRPFDEVRKFARSLQLTAQAQWYAFARGRLPSNGKRPDDIPSAPWQVYAAKGWTNWGDFLGTDNPARRTVRYRPFAQARAFVRKLGLANASEWRAFCRKKSGNRRFLPPDIPAAPDRVYANQGWVSFGDWVGNGRVHASKVTYRSYAEARAFVRELAIGTEPEWRAYCRGEIRRATPRPLDVPSNPHRTYKGCGWRSWGHFLGTNNVALYKRVFRPFELARAFVRNQRFADTKAWRAWCAAGKRPGDIPGAPDLIYRDRGWINWADFLGSPNVLPRRVRRPTLREARAIVRCAGITTRTEFQRAWHARRIPREIPLTIDRMPGWVSWKHFLG